MIGWQIYSCSVLIVLFQVVQLYLNVILRSPLYWYRQNFRPKTTIGIMPIYETLWTFCLLDIHSHCTLRIASLLSTIRIFSVCIWRGMMRVVEVDCVLKWYLLCNFESRTCSTNRKYNVPGNYTLHLYLDEFDKREFAGELNNKVLVDSQIDIVLISVAVENRLQELVISKISNSTFSRYKDKNRPHIEMNMNLKRIFILLSIYFET